MRRSVSLRLASFSAFSTFDQQDLKNLVCLLFCLVISLSMQLSRYNGEIPSKTDVFRKSHPLAGDQLNALSCFGGDSGDRTRDLLLARQALSQTELCPHMIQDSGPED